MDTKTIKKNFDEIRRQKGLKIEQICTKMGGISRQALYNYFKTGITLKSLCNLAAAIDTTPAELLKENDDKIQKIKLTCNHCGKPIYLYISK